MTGERILLAHGSGGRMSQRLVADIFKKEWGNPLLDQMLDAAVLTMAGTKLAFSTDSFVVDPLFFPGGDIGKLAVCGTVNDLAVTGADPCYLSVGMILEEGFLLEDLRRIVHSMAQAAEQAGVRIVAGDTKVVERGEADKIFINTAGIGVLPESAELLPSRLCPGDAILVSGRLGEHGLAILAGRKGISFNTPVESDCRPLQRLTKSILTLGDNIRCMRDPTRGGLATTLNELAQQGNVGMVVREKALPIAPTVAGACDMLGLDPLYLANEGKVVVFIAPEYAEEALQIMRSLPEGRDACRIGEVTEGKPGKVLLETSLGTWRILQMLEGEQLPRIC